MTSTDLATRTTPGGLDSKIKYAQALASASLLPRAYVNQPANVLLAMELGEALGISSIQAINGIHVIEGKPSASADLIASLVRRAGHKLRVTVDDENNVAVAQIIRADDPDFTYTCAWNEAKARAAGLWGKGNWSKHPGQMLRNRAITEVCRMGASDALYGVIYTPEELGAETNSEGDPISITQVQAEPAPGAKPPTMADAIAAHQVINQPAPAEDKPPLGDRIYREPEASDEPETGVTQIRTVAQSKKLAVLLRELGMDNRDEALAYIGNLIGADIESTKDLTVHQCHTVIDHLQALADKANGIDTETGEVVEAELVDASDEWPTSAAVAR